MIDTPPPIRLLEAIKLTLEPVDYATLAGVPGVLIRHRRNRHAKTTEMPSIGVRYVDDDGPDDDQPDLTFGERQRVLTVDLVADLELDSEDSGDDPTGNLKLALMLAAAVQALKEPGSPLDLLSDYVSVKSLSPDEDSKPDQGRLVRTIIVLYRVSVDDENVLLAEGMNA